MTQCNVVINRFPLFGQGEYLFESVGKWSEEIIVFLKL